MKVNEVLEGVFNFLIGTNEEIAEILVNDKRVPLIFATGSPKWGRKVSAKVASRLWRSILELGGNNAIIVTESADLKIAIAGIVLVLWEHAVNAAPAHVGLSYTNKFT